jgi:geranylgeranyl transferase type-2 subunit alpha
LLRSELEMHGRKKTLTVASDAELAAIQRKADSLSATVQTFFDLKKKGDKTDVALEFTGKLLKINPDFYSVWNYRKEILVFNNAALLAPAEDKSQLIVDNDLREKELKLSEDCITKSPKSCEDEIA